MSVNAPDESVQSTSGDTHNAAAANTPQLGQNSNQVSSTKNPIQNNAFSHPGARAICEGAASRDGPYTCRKCAAAGLTVTVTPCPACLDTHPWLPLD